MLRNVMEVDRFGSRQRASAKRAWIRCGAFALMWGGDLGGAAGGGTVGCFTGIQRTRVGSVQELSTAEHSAQP